VCVRINVCVHVCVCVYMHVCVRVSMKAAEIILGDVSCMCVCVRVYLYVYICLCVRMSMRAADIISGDVSYGVATICRLLKIIDLFCKIALSKRPYSAKETYNFKEPTNHSYPICA